MAEEWRKLGETVALTHPYVTVTYHAVALPDGVVIPDWPIIYLRDYVNVVVLNDQGETLIQEGYRYALGQTTWQIVGGLLEPGEEPLEAAQRELLEETGYVCAEWQMLGHFVADANRHCGAGHFFLARRPVLAAAPHSGDLEQVTLQWLPLAELRVALFSGRFGVMSHAINAALALLLLSHDGPRG